MSWGPRDFVNWGQSVKAFFSERGMVVKKFVLPSDKEGEFFMAAIEDPDRNPELDGLKDTLLGVKLLFTPSLKSTFLFMVENDRTL